jgi:competence ComEA-like helix-hairpin-helix protein
MINLLFASAVAASSLRGYEDDLAHAPGQEFHHLGDVLKDMGLDPDAIPVQEVPFNSQEPSRRLSEAGIPGVDGVHDFVMGAQGANKTYTYVMSQNATGGLPFASQLISTGQWIVPDLADCGGHCEFIANGTVYLLLPSWLPVKNCELGSVKSKCMCLGGQLKLTKSPFGIFFEVGSAESCTTSNYGLDKVIQKLTRVCVSEGKPSSPDLCVSLLKKELIIGPITLPLSKLPGGSFANGMLESIEGLALEQKAKAQAKLADIDKDIKVEADCTETKYSASLKTDEIDFGVSDGDEFRTLTKGYSVCKHLPLNKDLKYAWVKAGGGETEYESNRQIALPLGSCLQKTTKEVMKILNNTDDPDRSLDEDGNDTDTPPFCCKVCVGGFACGDNCLPTWLAHTCNETIGCACFDRCESIDSCCKMCPHGQRACGEDCLPYDEDDVSAFANACTAPWLFGCACNAKDYDHCPRKVPPANETSSTCTVQCLKGKACGDTCISKKLTCSKVDVNKAGQEALETLYGLGPVKGAAVIAYREAHGDFAQVADLANVNGVGAGTVTTMLAKAGDTSSSSRDPRPVTWTEPIVGSKACDAVVVPTKTCCKTCRNSKACGDGCIEFGDTCSITTEGCACDAKPPPQTQKPTCCAVCKKGKACGNSCISKDKSCNVNTPPGCACDFDDETDAVLIGKPTCCVKCKTGKPCGSTCIEKGDTCYEEGGCACWAGRETSLAQSTAPEDVEPVDSETADDAPGLASYTEDDGQTIHTFDYTDKQWYGGDEFSCDTVCSSGKPCGKSCISKNKECHKDPRPATSSGCQVSNDATYYHSCGDDWTAGTPSVCEKQKKKKGGKYKMDAMCVAYDVSAVKEGGIKGALKRPSFAFQLDPPIGLKDTLGDKVEGKFPAKGFKLDLHGMGFSVDATLRKEVKGFWHGSHYDDRFTMDMTGHLWVKMQVAFPVYGMFFFDITGQLFTRLPVDLPVFFEALTSPDTDLGDSFTGELGIIIEADASIGMDLGVLRLDVPASAALAIAYDPELQKTCGTRTLPIWECTNTTTGQTVEVTLVGQTPSDCENWVSTGRTSTMPVKSSFVPNLQHNGVFFKGEFEGDKMVRKESADPEEDGKTYLFGCPPEDGEDCNPTGLNKIMNTFVADLADAGGATLPNIQIDAFFTFCSQGIKTAGYQMRAKFELYGVKADALMQITYGVHCQSCRDVYDHFANKYGISTTSADANATLALADKKGEAGSNQDIKVSFELLEPMDVLDGTITLRSNGACSYAEDGKCGPMILMAYLDTSADTDVDEQGHVIDRSGFFIAASAALDVFGYNVAAADIFITEDTMDLHGNITIPVLPIYPIRIEADITRRPLPSGVGDKWLLEGGVYFPPQFISLEPLVDLVMAIPNALLDGFDAQIDNARDVLVQLETDCRNLLPGGALDSLCSVVQLGQLALNLAEELIQGVRDILERISDGFKEVMSAATTALNALIPFQLGNVYANAEIHSGPGGDLKSVYAEFNFWWLLMGAEPTPANMNTWSLDIDFTVGPAEFALWLFDEITDRMGSVASDVAEFFGLGPVLDALEEMEDACKINLPDPFAIAGKLLGAGMRAFKSLKLGSKFKKIGGFFKKKRKKSGRKRRFSGWWATPNCEMSWHPTPTRTCSLVACNSYSCSDVTRSVILKCPRGSQILNGKDREYCSPCPAGTYSDFEPTFIERFRQVKDSGHADADNCGCKWVEDTPRGYPYPYQSVSFEGVTYPWRSCADATYKWMDFSDEDKTPDFMLDDFEEALNDAQNVVPKFRWMAVNATQGTTTAILTVQLTGTNRDDFLDDNCKSTYTPTADVTYEVWDSYDMTAVNIAAQAPSATYTWSTTLSKVCLETEGPLHNDKKKTSVRGLDISFPGWQSSFVESTPITAIDIIGSTNTLEGCTGKCDDAIVQTGYTKIPVDLNKGAGGRYAYLTTARNNESTRVIRSAFVMKCKDFDGDWRYFAGSQSKSGNPDPCVCSSAGAWAADYTMAGSNLNMGTGANHFNLLFFCLDWRNASTYTGSVIVDFEVRHSTNQDSDDWDAADKMPAGDGWSEAGDANWGGTADGDHYQVKIFQRRRSQWSMAPSATAGSLSRPPQLATAPANDFNWPTAGHDDTIQFRWEQAPLGRCTATEPRFDQSISVCLPCPAGSFCDGGEDTSQVTLGDPDCAGGDVVMVTGQGTQINGKYCFPKTCVVSGHDAACDDDDNCIQPPCGPKCCATAISDDDDATCEKTAAPCKMDTVSTGQDANICATVSKDLSKLATEKCSGIQTNTFTFSTRDLAPQANFTYEAHTQTFVIDLGGDASCSEGQVSDNGFGRETCFPLDCKVTGLTANEMTRDYDTDFSNSYEWECSAASNCNTTIGNTTHCSRCCGFYTASMTPHLNGLGYYAPTDQPNWNPSGAGANSRAGDSCHFHKAPCFMDAASGVSVLDGAYDYPATTGNEWCVGTGLRDPLPSGLAKGIVTNTHVDGDGTGGLENCQGDCDSDSDCAGDLVCMEVQDNGSSEEEGNLDTLRELCRVTDDIQPMNNWDFCVPPRFIRSTKVNRGSTSRTWGECEGDCDSDDDCDEGLVCHHRDGWDDEPHCAGTAKKNWDYCLPALELEPQPCNGTDGQKWANNGTHIFSPTAKHTCWQPGQAQGGNAAGRQIVLGSCQTGGFTMPYGMAAATQHTRCPPGKFQFDTQAGYCYECEAGKFTPLQGATQCYTCQVGKASSKGSDTCTRCAPGYYAGAGADECRACPAGQYQRNVHVGFEYNSNRFYASRLHATSCENCTVGRYQSNTTRVDAELGEVYPRDCKVCAAGTIQTQPGQWSCEECETGRYTTYNRLVCYDCTQGTFGNESLVASSAGHCQRCAAGRYAPSAASKVCITCPAGKHGNEPHLRHRCLGCPAGQVTAAAGGDNCTSCASGSVPNADKTECVVCPRNTYSVDRRSDLTGFSSYLTPAAGACEPCPAGKYTLTAGASECKTMCGIGYEADEKGECMMCPYGRYKDWGVSSRQGTGGQGNRQWNLVAAGRFGAWDDKCIAHAGCGAKMGRPSRDAERKWEGPDCPVFMARCDEACGTMGTNWRTQGHCRPGTPTSEPVLRCHCYWRNGNLAQDFLIPDFTCDRYHRNQVDNSPSHDFTDTPVCSGYGSDWSDDACESPRGYSECESPRLTISGFPDAYALGIQSATITENATTYARFTRYLFNWPGGDALGGFRMSDGTNGVNAWYNGVNLHNGINKPSGTNFAYATLAERTRNLQDTLENRMAASPGFCQPCPYGRTQWMTNTDGFFDSRCVDNSPPPPTPAPTPTCPAGKFNEYEGGAVLRSLRYYDRIENQMEPMQLIGGSNGDSGYGGTDYTDNFVDNYGYNGDPGYGGRRLFVLAPSAPGPAPPANYNGGGMGSISGGNTGGSDSGGGAQLDPDSGLLPGDLPGTGPTVTAPPDADIGDCAPGINGCCVGAWTAWRPCDYATGLRHRARKILRYGGGTEQISVSAVLNKACNFPNRTETEPCDGCYDCPAGTFSDGANWGECASCPLSKYSEGGASACDNCTMTSCLGAQDADRSLRWEYVNCTSAGDATCVDCGGVGQCPDADDGFEAPTPAPAPTEAPAIVIEPPAPTRRFDCVALDSTTGTGQSEALHFEQQLPSSGMLWVQVGFSGQAADDAECTLEVNGDSVKVRASPSRDGWELTGLKVDGASLSLEATTDNCFLTAVYVQSDGVKDTPQADWQCAPLGGAAEAFGAMWRATGCSGTLPETLAPLLMQFSYDVGAHALYDVCSAASAGSSGFTEPDYGFAGGGSGTAVDPGYGGTDYTDNFVGGASAPGLAPGFGRRLGFLASFSDNIGSAIDVAQHGALNNFGSASSVSQTIQEAITRLNNPDIHVGEPVHEPEPFRLPSWAEQYEGLFQEAANLCAAGPEFTGQCYARGNMASMWAGSGCPAPFAPLPGLHEIDNADLDFDTHVGELIADVCHTAKMDTGSSGREARVLCGVPESCNGDDALLSLVSVFNAHTASNGNNIQTLANELSGLGLTTQGVSAMSAELSVDGTATMVQDFPTAAVRQSVVAPPMPTFDEMIELNALSSFEMVSYECTDPADWEAYDSCTKRADGVWKQCHSRPAKGDHCAAQTTCDECDDTSYRCNFDGMVTADLVYYDQPIWVHTAATGACTAYTQGSGTYEDIGFATQSDCKAKCGDDTTPAPQDGQCNFSGNYLTDLVQYPTAVWVHTDQTGACEVRTSGSSTFMAVGFPSEDACAAACEECECCPEGYQCMVPRGGAEKRCVGPGDEVVPAVPCPEITTSTTSTTSSTTTTTPTSTTTGTCDFDGNIVKDMMLFDTPLWIHTANGCGCEEKQDGSSTYLDIGFGSEEECVSACGEGDCASTSTTTTPVPELAFGLIGDSCGTVFGPVQPPPCLSGLVCVCVGLCADDSVADAPHTCRQPGQCNFNGMALTDYVPYDTTMWVHTAATGACEPHTAGSSTYETVGFTTEDRCLNECASASAEEVTATSSTTTTTSSASTTTTASSASTTSSTTTTHISGADPNEICAEETGSWASCTYDWDTKQTVVHWTDTMDHWHCKSHCTESATSADDCSCACVCVLGAVESCQMMEHYWHSQDVHVLVPVGTSADDCHLAT